MKNLVEGSVARHLGGMAAPIAIGMLVQTLYYLVDLYFVGRLGNVALAGVGAAGNLTFVVLALTQMLGVGTVALIAQAVGRKDQADANLVFNQSLLISVACMLLTWLAGYGLAGRYFNATTADAGTAAAGRAYLYAVLPGLGLQFALIAMGSALRGTGVAKPTMLVQMFTVLVNILLAPVLIAGWLTHRPLGVAGAGLATSLSVAAGVGMMTLYYGRLEHYVAFHREQWQPRWPVWKRIFNIGLPAGGEFLLMFVILAVIYSVIRPFGPAAQAGFSVGGRVMQALFLPAMAVAFAVAPVAGQNVGAQRHDRVVATFRSALWIGSLLMLAAGLGCFWQGRHLLRLFTTDPEAIEVGAHYLRMVSWNFVASGIIFTCSGMFQALGNTWPSLSSSATRLVTFVAPVLWLGAQPGFRIEQVWRLSVITVFLQALLSLWLVTRALRRAAPATPAASPADSVALPTTAPLEP